MGWAGMGRWGKRAVLGLGGLLVCLSLAVGGLFVWLGLDSSRRMLLGFAEEALAGSGLYLKVAETSGQLPFKLRLGGVSLADSAGVWLDLDEATLDFSPFRLFGLIAQVNSLRLDGLRLSRLPVLRDQAGPEQDSGAVSPGGLSLPVDIRLDELVLTGGRVAPELLRGPPGFGALAVSARASALARRGSVMEPGNITAEVRAEVDTERGRLLGFDFYTGPGGGLPDSLRLSLNLAEEERGLLAALAGLESLPAYDLRLASESSLRDIRLDFALRSDLLADLSGSLALAPIGGALRQNSLEGLLTPNWLADLAMRARPGPRLFEPESFFAALPASAADLLGPEIDLTVSASSEVSGESAVIRLGELRLENSLLAAGLSGGDLRVAGLDRPRLDFGGNLLAQVKDGRFFTLLGLQSAEAPMLGAGSLRLGGRAGLELGGDAPQGEFSFTGPLAAESFMSGASPVNLAFNLELRGKFSDALTLEALRLEGMGLEIKGRSRLVPNPLTLDLALEASGRGQGEWAGVLPGLDTVLRDLGFSGSLEARLDSGHNIAGRLSLSASGLSWPLPELERRRASRGPAGRLFRAVGLALQPQSERAAYRDGAACALGL